MEWEKRLDGWKSREVTTYIGRSQSDNWQSVTDSMGDFLDRLYASIEESPVGHGDWDTVFIHLRLESGRLVAQIGPSNVTRQNSDFSILYFDLFIESEFHKFSDAIPEDNEALFIEGYDRLFGQTVAALDAAVKRSKSRLQHCRAQAHCDFRICVTDSGELGKVMDLPLADGGR